MFQEAFPILTAGDMARALGLYCDLLGCTVTSRFPDDGEPAYPPGRPVAIVMRRTG